MTRDSKLDQVLTLIFMLFAIAAVVSYIYTFSSSDKRAFLICAGIAILIRIAQYILRFFHK
jgi:hypothetical protein